MSISWKSRMEISGRIISILKVIGFLVDSNSFSTHKFTEHTLYLKKKIPLYTAAVSWLITSNNAFILNLIYRRCRITWFNKLPNIPSCSKCLVLLHLLVSCTKTSFNSWGHQVFYKEGISFCHPYQEICFKLHQYSKSIVCFILSMHKHFHT